MGVRDRKKGDYLGDAARICKRRARELQQRDPGQTMEAVEELHYVARMMEELIGRPYKRHGGEKGVYRIAYFREQKTRNWNWEGFGPRRGYTVVELEDDDE